MLALFTRSVHAKKHFEEHHARKLWHSTVFLLGLMQFSSFVHSGMQEAFLNFLMSTPLILILKLLCMAPNAYLIFFFSSCVQDPNFRFNMAEDQIEPTEVDSDSDVGSWSSSITGDIKSPPSPSLNPNLWDPEDVPWYEAEFLQRVDDDLQGPVQGCEVPGILKLYFNEDHRWQFEGEGCLHLQDEQVEQLKPWLNLRRLSASEVPIPGENSSRSSGEMRIDESAPLTEMLAQLLESMQPGFKQTLPWVLTFL